MKKILLLIPAALLLNACSPHPGAGNWTATEENPWGIPGLTLSFEGRGLFTSKTPPATWHCFWSGESKTSARLDCTPSTDTKQEDRFDFQVNEDGIGTLTRQGKILGHFRRVEGKPEI